MISIIRMKAQENREKIWDNILDQLDNMKESIEGKGALLYLSQRARQQDASLFLHVIEPNTIGDFIIRELSNIQDITSIWAIHLMKPLFFPLPKDTEHLTRYTITTKVFPSRLSEVYETLVKQHPLDEVQMAYIAFTFHLFEESLIFSILAKDCNSVEKFVKKNLDIMPGVLGTHINTISKTKPLVSYKKWKEYALHHSIVPSWDTKNMIKNFQI